MRSCVRMYVCVCLQMNTGSIIVLLVVTVMLMHYKKSTKHTHIRDMGF